MINYEKLSAWGVKLIVLLLECIDYLFIYGESEVLLF